MHKIILGILLLFAQTVSAHTDFLNPNHHHDDGYSGMINNGFDGIRNALSAPERRAAEERKNQQEAERLRLERERLRLERDRVELERQKAQQQNNYTQKQSGIEHRQTYAKNWVNSISVLSYQGNVLANLSIPNAGNGYKQVYFSYNESSCTSKGVPVPNGMIFVNGVAINTLAMCNANQTAMTWAATKAEVDIISEEFKRKRVVVVEDAEKKSELVFSAKGFSNQWNKYP